MNDLSGGLRREVHWWLARSDDRSVDHRQLLGWLGTDERAKATRFLDETDRRRYVVAHAMLRDLLSRYQGKGEPLAIRISSQPASKPRLSYWQHLRGWRFNLSHRGEVAIVAVGRHCEIGVDVEDFRRSPWSHTNADPETEARRWVTRESVIKALGSGLADIDRYEIGPGYVEIDRTGRRARNSLVLAVHVLELDLAGYVAALAVSSDRVPVFKGWWRPDQPSVL